MTEMDALRQIFFQECEEQLSALESGLLEIEGGDTDSEIVNAVFRAVHSIKGGAGAFALEDLVRFAHVFETVLDEVRKGRLATTAPVVETLLRAADVLADLVRVARDGGAVDEARIRTASEELAALSGVPGAAAGEPEESVDDLGFMPVAVALPIFDDASAEPEPETSEYTITFKPHASLYANANEPAVLLRELGRLGEISVTCDTAAVPLLQDLDPEGSYLAWAIALKTTHGEDDVRGVFEFVDTDCDLVIGSTAEAAPGAGDDEIEALLRRIRGEAGADVALADVKIPTLAEQTPEPEFANAPNEPLPAAQKADAPKGEKSASAEAAQQTIRVDLDRVDRLMNLVGELVINQAMLSQRLVEAGLSRSSEFQTGLDEFEQLTRDIQEGVMAIRAQPVKSVFQRMPRLVREGCVGDRKESAPRHRRRRHRGRQDGDRASRRPADAHDPQCDRPWPGKAGRAYRQRQARGGPRPAFRDAPLGAHRDRHRRRRRRHQPPARQGDR